MKELKQRLAEVQGDNKVLVPLCTEVMTLHDSVPCRCLQCVIKHIDHSSYTVVYLHPTATEDDHRKAASRGRRGGDSSLSSP